MNICEFGFRDWLLIAQILLGLAPWIALYIVYNQLQTHGQLLKLNTSAIRHQHFIALTDCLTDKIEETMLLHVIDHFQPDVYRARYEGKETATKSYLLMKRKYLYLLVSFRLERNFPLPEKGTAKIWIQELCRYQEFRDVHESQKHYYKEFGPYVDELIGDRKVEGWMFEAHLEDSQKTHST